MRKNFVTFSLKLLAQLNYYSNFNFLDFEYQEGLKISKSKFWCVEDQSKLSKRDWHKSQLVSAPKFDVIHQISK